MPDDPAIFVVNGVCRYTIHGLWTNSRPVDNIVDMRIDTTGTTTDRHDALVDQGEIILNQWVADVMPALVNNYSVGYITWIDLDDVDGEVGMYTYPGGATGSDTGGEATPNVALLVHKQIGTRPRGTRPGRMYVAGLTEAAVDGNGLIAGDFTSIFEDWRGNIEQSSGGSAPEYDSKIVVVHGAPKKGDTGVITGTSSDVSALAVDNHAATQRRRLRK